MSKGFSIIPHSTDDLAGRISGLSPVKRALLEVQLKKREADASGKPIIPRRADDGPAPLSFAQQRLWFLDQFEPGSPFYNISRAIRIDGLLNVEALQKTLDAIVARHEILRTTLVSVDGSPVQVIAENRSLRLEMIDLSECPDSERQAERDRLLNSEARRSFNLSSDLMLRATLLRLGREEHVLLLTTHHVASDGWSMGVLIRELSALYEAFCAGEPSPLAELPIQYADFAVWQRNWLQGEVLDSQLGYWKKQLAGAPAVLEIPTDRSHPAVQTYRGARQSLRLSKKLTEALKGLSRREGVTLFMTLLAAFKSLLYRYTGQEDIVVGSPIAGRTRREIEGLIGFFVNTLVLRSDLSGNPTFRQLLGRVREVALGGYAHQDMPFEKLVEELQPERNLSHSPLFQVMFALQNVPRKPLELPGLTLSPMRLGNDTAKFDLTLEMGELDGGLFCLFEYNTDLFDGSTITRMVGHFQTLLEGIVADPGQRLSGLSILTDAERRQLLVEWNDTKRDYPKDQCIHQLFEEQVERTPDAVAVVFEDKQLTYRELNQRANQLAHYLKRLGVGPEVFVGLCVERSFEMLVGLLGILKAGGAYLPLDPTYPQERLGFMLEDSHAAVLLTQQSLVGGLIEDRELKPALSEAEGIENGDSRFSILDPRIRWVCLDTDWGVIAAESEENPLIPVTADTLAYVIYTSGSTGMPKGVLISHGSIAHQSLDTQACFELNSNDRALQFSTSNFDTSLEEILPTLISGATLVLKDAEIWSPVEFGGKLSDLHITVANLPTAYWHELAQARLDGAGPGVLQELRLVVVGGEAMSSAALKLWRQTPLSHVRLLNGYGPTETTITATTSVIAPQLSGEVALEKVSIGRPLGDRKVYILDRLGNPSPVGIPGELHIGGIGLARGYLNLPGLTAEKFIPNPFSDERGARLYKSGDLARYLPDGNIEFLGRIDNQVKIRGFRIEPGEVEAALGQHPDVRESVVTARDDGAGDKLLVAYIVPRREPRPTINALRNFLKQKLPDYMVPSAFVFLDSLPLTPNGKVDRRALPAPDGARPELEQTFVAPRTPAEKTLAGIWAEVLRLEPVGIHDNFFELGGHSLLATQVISRLRTAFQVELPLRALFEKPTVAELAEVIEEVIIDELEKLTEDEAEQFLKRNSAVSSRQS